MSFVCRVVWCFTVSDQSRWSLTVRMTSPVLLSILITSTTSNCSTDTITPDGLMAQVREMEIWLTCEATRRYYRGTFRGSSEQRRTGAPVRSAEPGSPLRVLWQEAVLRVQCTAKKKKEKLEYMRAKEKDESPADSFEEGADIKVSATRKKTERSVVQGR